MKPISLQQLSPLPQRRSAALAPAESPPALPQDSLQLSPTPAPSSGWRKAGLAAAAALSCAGLISHPAAAATVKVLSLNVWLDCKDGADNIAELIRKSQADIVGLQETKECTETLAKNLGYSWVQQGHYTGMLSRFPIESTTPNRHGMTVRLDSGQPLAVFNLHLFHEPYQPYQLLGIPYGDHPFVHTEEEARQQALQARGHDVQSALQDIASVQSQKIPMVLTGDFNEPSHLDWTQKAFELGRHPLKVEWPASKTFADNGWKDSYRKLHPDEITHPGFTWTPRTQPDDPKDHHDRLDFVLYQGEGIQPTSVKIVGEKSPQADIVVTPYPTDHRGVLAEMHVR